MFRGLDIGTAKASPAERARVPHHGLDLVEPDQPFSVADFAGHAEASSPTSPRAAASRSWPAAPASTCGPSPAASTPTPCRATRRSGRGSRPRLTHDGLMASVLRLEALAPELAAGVDLRNPRRVVRALEIAELRGDAPRPPARGYPGPVAWIGLRLEPDVHRERIAARARAQFDAGLVEEARALRERFDPGLPAFSAIGYREAWSVLDGDAHARGPRSRRTSGATSRSRSARRRGSARRRTSSGSTPRQG